MPSMYVIVKFLRGCEVALVSSKWLRGSSATYWPPVHSEYKRAKMVRAHVKPESNWELHDITVLYHHTDYNMAVRRLSLVENRSERTSSGGSAKRSTRKRKRPERLIEIMEPDASDGDPQSSGIHPSASPSSPTTTEAMQVVSSTFISPSPPSTPPEQRFAGIPDSFVELMELLLSKIDESITHQKELDRKLSILLARESSSVKSTGVTSSCENDPVSFQFPLYRMRDFEIFERQMNNPVLFDQMMTELCLLGGGCLVEVVRRFLRHLFAVPLALRINWTGKNEKKAFCNSKACTLLQQICARNPVTSKATPAEIGAAVRFWFRLNCDRERTRLKKAKTMAPWKVNTIADNQMPGCESVAPNPMVLYTPGSQQRTSSFL